MKAVLDTKVESAYDDDVASRYHFPSRYLADLSAAVGDWVVFRQPRAAGGSLAYFATARIVRIEPDPQTLGHHYAIVEDYLPFDRPTPWRQNGRYAEAALRDILNVPQVGLYLRGRSVRPLGEADFAAIVEQGFADIWAPDFAREAGVDEDALALLVSKLPLDPAERIRRIVERLVNRTLRDEKFKKAVRLAYDYSCAISGLRLFDRKGLPEVQAAHIWSVADGGPDMVQNGIALSGTLHWLFDRHMISLTNDFRLLVSARLSLPESMGRSGRDVSLPENQRYRPSLDYLARHREKFERAEAGLSNKV